jgi:hypothetical protein
MTPEPTGFFLWRPRTTPSAEAAAPLLCKKGSFLVVQTANRKIKLASVEIILAKRKSKLARVRFLLASFEKKLAKGKEELTNMKSTLARGSLN